HALRDTPHVPVAAFPRPPVHGHLRHPPHGITERAERPPRRHFHGATARVAVQKPDPPIVRQDFGPTLDIRCDLKHPIHGCADRDLVNRVHHFTVSRPSVTTQRLCEPPVGTAPPLARLRPAACHRTPRVYIPAGATAPRRAGSRRSSRGRAMPPIRRPWRPGSGAGPRAPRRAGPRSRTWRSSARRPRAAGGAAPGSP